jgi:hypothetical protein
MFMARPPSTNDGRTRTGKSMRATATASSSDIAMPDSPGGGPSLTISSLKSRSSALISRGEVR